MTPLQARKVPQSIRQRLEQQGIHPLLARLYAARGIQTKDEVDYSFKSLLPPARLAHADEAARLLADAIEARARILIVADYDCDGATACAVGIHAIKAMSGNAGTQIDYLTPNRFIHGYGLTPEIVALAAERKPDLIVTVDNGIASLAGVAAANELGISTLITDHHLPGDALPDADCIVNPNLPECDFPSKCLAGVGVLFYVMLALRAELRDRGWFHAERPEPNLASLLDLVALGTVADVVQLDGNNRILVNQGIKRLRAGQMTVGIRALFQAAGVAPSKAGSLDLGFRIGPRLNAAGRLSDMSLGIECLLTGDPARALNIAQQLDALNRERKTIEAGMQKQALDAIDTISTSGEAAIALFDPAWHKGVVGLLAARIKDRHHRPVFAFARDDGESADGQIRGSGRAIPGLHLRDALDLISKRAPGLLLHFGGHASAAGASIRESDFSRFQEIFIQVASELLSPADLTRVIETDGPLESGYFSPNIVHLLENEVWGQGFPPPLFEDEFSVESQRLLKEKHLKLRLRKGDARIDAIRFNFDAAAGEKPGKSIRAAYRLEINEYNGVQTPQLIIEHMET
ncbi:MAG: single-stranded-DNA-specific exonuclease RecJ [Candidatus Accumulibacter sp.]|jgi:single-stranded-DNA-specific exonuclease|nr:single-stranded-DNA-specific exonuclease RecJ [Accumulibacter sp.]